MKPQSLFRRTTWTLVIALLVFQTLVFSAIAFLVTIPLGTRATDDLASLMIISAKTWVELPPGTRSEFEHELQYQHGLYLNLGHAPVSEHTSYLPYRLLLEQALSSRLNKTVSVLTTFDPEFYWVDITMAGQDLHIGIERDRIGTHPYYALMIIFIALMVILFITAYLLTRHLTHPLIQFTHAALAVGRGQAPATLPVTGPAEIAVLARTFNKMAQDVNELLANRTTMLAGISHDLRTPLARLRLTIEMLPGDTDPSLMTGLQRDLEAMDELIGQYLDLSRGMADETEEIIDLREIVDGCVTDARRSGIEIHWTPAVKPMFCLVRTHALVRILTNLLNNAQRYGDSHKIDVECKYKENIAMIKVLDRGTGIPESELNAVFRPFHRLESARSSKGGGSGLGLAIARQLADANNWKLELSARSGGGTIACIEIVCTNLSKQEDNAND